MQFLSHQQTQRVEEIARRKSVQCPECGSSDLTAENRAGVWFGAGVGADVRLECLNDHRAVPLELSEDEADYVGIDLGAYGPPETGG